MATEDLTGGDKFINALNANNPDGGDSVTFGDNHIAGHKNVTLNTFPGVAWPCLATPTPGGTANVITATLSPAITALVTNMEVLLDISTANTAAATLNLNSIGAKAIIHPDGTALGGGELDGFCHLKYNGTAFELLSASVHPTGLQNGHWTVSADTGAADAHVLTYTPAVTAYAAGQIFWFEAGFTNTGACTAAVNGLAATSIKNQDGTDPAAGDIVAGGFYGLAYTAAATFVIITALGNTPASAGTDKQVRVSSADTTSGYLAAKILGGAVTTDGGNEVFSPLGYVTKTANYTAVNGDQIAADTSTVGAWTLTMPASPVAGETWVSFTDHKRTFDSANLTIGRNGSNIMGTAEDLTIDIRNFSGTLLFIDSTDGWIFV